MINIDDGNNNVITHAFELINQQIISCHMDLENEELSHMFENLMWNFVRRITNNNEMYWIQQQYEWNRD